jgi:hypothetical protein
MKEVVMELVPVILIGTLAYTAVIFLKNLSAQQWRSAVTQVVAWLAGIGAMLVLAETQFAGGITVGGVPADRLEFWSKVFVGVLAASLLSTVHELKKAFDRTDTAAVPDWFEPEAEATLRSHLTVPAHFATAEELATARRQVRANGPTSTPAAPTPKHG